MKQMFKDKIAEIERLRKDFLLIQQSVLCQLDQLTKAVRDHLNKEFQKEFNNSSFVLQDAGYNLEGGILGDEWKCNVFQVIVVSKEQSSKFQRSDENGIDWATDNRHELGKFFKKMTKDVGIKIELDQLFGDRLGRR